MWLSHQKGCKKQEKLRGKIMEKIFININFTAFLAFIIWDNFIRRLNYKEN